MPQPEEKKRGTWSFVLLSALLLACVPLAFWLFLHEPALPPAAVPASNDAGPPPVEIKALEIADLAGKVEVRKGLGSFEPARVGERLEEQDAIRTSEGKARLRAESRYTVDVEAGSLLEVGALTERLARLKLGLGMLTAKVVSTGEMRVEVSALGADAVTTTSNGAFSMSSNGSGTVAVGAHEGEVELSAAGKAVLLRAGQQSIASNGAAPSAPAPIPASLLLKIDWPTDKEINHRVLTVAGQAVPGAIVVIGGRSAKVESDGRFRTQLHLREGRNALEARCTDVGGNQSIKRAEFLVDTVGPNANIPTDKLWEQ